MPINTNKKYVTHDKTVWVVPDEHKNIAKKFQGWIFHQSYQALWFTAKLSSL